MYRDKILGKEELEVLKYIRKTYAPDAIIAGGAVRDMVFDKPYKDVDIWFRKTKIDVPQRFFEILLPRDLEFKIGEDCVDIPLHFMGERLEGVTGIPHADHLRVGRHGIPRETLQDLTIIDDVPENQDLSGVLFQKSDDPRRKVEWMLSFHYKGSQYQLMNVNITPEKFVQDEFDIGLCKIWHNGTNLIETAPFKKDREEKTFSIDGKHLGKLNFDWAIKRHLPRLKALYPEFKENIISLPEIVEKPKRKPRKDLSSGAFIVDWNTIPIPQPRAPFPFPPPDDVRNHTMNPINGEIYEIGRDDGTWITATQWHWEMTPLMNGELGPVRTRPETDIERTERENRETLNEAIARMQARRAHR